jgi:hypothetical protein
MNLRFFLLPAAMGIVIAALLSPVTVCAQSGNRDLAAQVKKLQAQVAELERKANQAQDYIALVNLEDAYGFYVDKCQWDQAADLFAKDSTLEIAGRGLYIGQDRVRAYLHRLPKFQYGQVFNHMQSQPVITIAPDAASAKARWRAVIQAGVLGKSAQWGEGTYENEYVKENGVWKFKTLHFFVTYYVDYDKGWDKGGAPPPAPMKDFPPDKPPTVDYKTYPDVFLPPYHYKNPVTGK